jgi:hypothetical protein
VIRDPPIIARSNWLRESPASPGPADTCFPLVRTTETRRHQPSLLRDFVSPWLFNGIRGTEAVRLVGLLDRRPVRSHAEIAEGQRYARTPRVGAGPSGRLIGREEPQEHKLTGSRGLRSWGSSRPMPREARAPVALFSAHLCGPLRFSALTPFSAPSASPARPQRLGASVPRCVVIWRR